MRRIGYARRLATDEDVSPSRRKVLNLATATPTPV